jgi:outer membrane protein OmpU
VLDFDGELGNEMAFIATGFNENALYQYSAGDFTGFVSVGQPEDNLQTYSVAARYSTDMLTAALGYEYREDEATQVIGSVSGTFADVTVKAIYGSISGKGNVLDTTQYGIGAGYAMDALSIDAFYRKTELDTASDVNSYGVGAAYDLGGGAAVEGGVARIEQDDASNTMADLGVTFRF